MIERRQDAQKIRDEFNALAVRVSEIESKQTIHIAQTNQTVKNTEDILEIFSAFKGAWKVLNWIGYLAKPLSIFGGGVIGWVYFRDHWRELVLWLK